MSVKIRRNIEHNYLYLRSMLDSINNKSPLFSNESRKDEIVYEDGVVAVERRLRY